MVEIMKYYQPFEDSYPYFYMNKQLAKQFEEYINKQSTVPRQLEDIMEDFLDTLPVSSLSRRNYRGRLRNFIEYIEQQQRRKSG